MGFRLTLTERLDDDIKAVARTQLDSALDALGDSVHTKGVHEARKRLKMLRAVVRLVRDPLGSAQYAYERATFREAGSRLSPMRDADVLLSTLDSLRRDVNKDRRPLIRELRAQLALERRTHARGLDDSLTFTRTTLEAARARIDDWPLRSLKMGDILDGFTSGYGRGREEFRAASAEPGDDPLHEWRKRAKDLWYHLRLLRGAWPCLTSAWADEAHRLSDLLGDDHDLAVLMQAFERMRGGDGDDAALDHVRAVALARRARLQREATALGARIYAEKRRPLRRRMRAYLHARRGEREVGRPDDLGMPAA